MCVSVCSSIHSLEPLFISPLCLPGITHSLGTIYTTSFIYFSTTLKYLFCHWICYYRVVLLIETVILLCNRAIYMCVMDQVTFNLDIHLFERVIYLPWQRSVEGYIYSKIKPSHGRYTNMPTKRCSHFIYTTCSYCSYICITGHSIPCHGICILSVYFIFKMLHAKEWTKISLPQDYHKQESPVLSFWLNSITVYQFRPSLDQI